MASIWRRHVRMNSLDRCTGMITFSKNRMSKIRITGEMSMPPRLRQQIRADRPQQRLGDPVQKVADRVHDLGLRVLTTLKATSQDRPPWRSAARYRCCSTSRKYRGLTRMKFQPSSRWAEISGSFGLPNKAGKTAGAPGLAAPAASLTGPNPGPKWRPLAENRANTNIAPRRRGRSSVGRAPRSQ